MAKRCASVFSKTLKLNSGYEMPMLGYGTWQSQDPAALKNGVKAAIQCGYRHIDTAFNYQNEHIIGEAMSELIEEGVVKRSDIFLTTKAHFTYYKPEHLRALIKAELKALKTDYIDLYLLHFPVPLAKPDEPNQLVKIVDNRVVSEPSVTHEDTWKIMEEFVDQGLVRSIGISNFNIKQTERLLKCGRIKPALNQVEVNPVFQNTKLVDFCQKNGVQVTGYSCFGSPGTINRMTGKAFCPVNILEDERLKKIGDKYGKNSAQVILRWLAQRNIIAIPKSLTPSRIADNANYDDFELTAEDMAEIAKIDTNKRNGATSLALPGVVDHPEWPFTEEGSC